MQKEYGHPDGNFENIDAEKWEIPEVCPQCDTPLHSGSKCPNCDYEVPVQPIE